MKTSDPKLGRYYRHAIKMVMRFTFLDSAKLVGLAEGGFYMKVDCKGKKEGKGPSQPRGRGPGVDSRILSLSLWGFFLWGGWSLDHPLNKILQMSSRFYVHQNTYVRVAQVSYYVGD